MNIAVVMGGYSDESVISLRSGQLILQNLDAAKYKAFEVHVLTEGWFAVVNNEHFNIDKSDFSFTKDGNKTQFDTIIKNYDLDVAKEEAYQLVKDFISK